MENNDKLQAIFAHEEWKREVSLDWTNLGFIRWMEINWHKGDPAYDKAQPKIANVIADLKRVTAARDLADEMIGK